MVTIRRAASAADRERCIALERKILCDDDPYTSPLAMWFLAEDDGQPIGFGAVTPLVAEPGRWFLARAGVAKSHRGLGVQRRLIRAREAYARRCGATSLTTYTSRENVRSANNLIKCGYRLYIPETWYGCGYAYYFERSLEKET